VKPLALLSGLGAVLVAACASSSGSSGGSGRAPIRVLILDGQNNHDWRRTTERLTAALNDAGLFATTVSTAPAKGSPPEAWQAWRPDFSGHQVVVSNYNGEDWPEPVRQDFVAFVERGGGVVMVHAANNPFPEWPEFNRMIGLGWRKPDFGDRITVDDASGALVRTAKGQGLGAGHGPSHVFQIRVRRPDHPIMRGLPMLWRHGKDQLSHGQRGPAAEMTVLDSAFSSKQSGGSGEHEPMTWVIPYGKGQVVTTMLGHQWRDQPDSDALDCIGFRTVFTRSVQWAATGLVTIPVPASFPTADTLSIAVGNRPGSPTAGR
jgi:hypothetical protein